MGTNSERGRAVEQENATKEPWFAPYDSANKQFDALDGLHIWDRNLKIEAPNMVYFVERFEANRWIISDQFRHGGQFPKTYKTRKAAREVLAKAGYVEAPAKFFGRV